MRITPNRGFTLIELLVVISIIGMLASIVVASVSSAREKAKAAVDMQNIKQIDTAIQMYYADYGHYPYLKNDGCDPGNLTTSLCIATSKDTATWSALADNLKSYLPQMPVPQNAKYVYISPGAVKIDCLAKRTGCPKNVVAMKNYYIDSRPIQSAGFGEITFSSGLIYNFAGPGSY